MAKSYIAKLNGKVVGKRTTKDRTYTHAIVVVPNVEYHRSQAYDRKANETDKSNYRYYCAEAEGRSKFNPTPEQMVRASMLIDGGFDAYAERIRQQYIEQFEKDLAAGRFEPQVVTWAGRPDLAAKAARQYVGPRYKDVVIVEAEEVLKGGANRLSSTR